MPTLSASRVEGGRSLAGAAGVACAVGVAIVWSTAAAIFVTAPTERLLQIVPDDTFYYLQIARNLVRLGRSTADGIFVTNGFHPLWMAICWVIARAAGNQESLLRSAIAMSFAIQGLAAVAIGRTLTPAIGRAWARAAALCWLVNPLAFLLASQATESSIYALTLLATLTAYRRLVAAPHSGSTRTLWLFGFALGVAFLARTEASVVVAAGLALCAYGSIRRGWTRQAAPVVATASAIIVCPWFLFSWMQTGTLVQDSGAMKMLWASSLNPGFQGHVRNLVETARFVVVRGTGLLLGFQIAPFLAGVLVLATGLAAAYLLTQKRAKPAATVVIPLTVAAFAVCLISGSILTERQVWWLTLPALTGFVALFAVLATVAPGRAGGSLLHVAVVLVGVALFSHAQWRSTPLYPWQPDVPLGQSEFDRVVPRGARVGCFNAGIPLFFGTSTIVALDGIVSHDARLAWSAHRVDDFITAAHVDYIADEQRSLNMALLFTRKRPDLRPVASHVLTGWPTGARRLWKLSDASSRR